MKRQHDQANGKTHPSSDEERPPKLSKSSRRTRSAHNKPAINKKKLNHILSEYGVLPLQDTKVAHPTDPEPETLLALVYLALLTSARISHNLAYKALEHVIEADYHKISVLQESSWEERTKILTEGGYARYREKTATGLGQLGEFVQEKYDGDLNNLHKKANGSPQKVRTLIQEVKDIGKVGADIFFDAAQSVWPSLAPFIDPRSLETAKKISLGSDVNALWEAVGKDAVEMCRLSSALTMIRLDKKVVDFE